MKFKNLALATSSLLIARNVAEASTPIVQVQTENSNSKLLQTKPLEEDTLPRIIPKVTSPETISECESCSQDKKKLPNLSQNKTKEEVSVTVLSHVAPPETISPNPQKLSSLAQSNVKKGVSVAATPQVTSPQTTTEWSNHTPKTTQAPIISDKKSREPPSSALLQPITPRQNNFSEIIPQVTPPETTSTCESSTQNPINSATSPAKPQSNIEASIPHKNAPCVAKIPPRDSVTNDAITSPHREPVIPAESQDSNYIKPPRIIPNSQLSTFTTTIPVNGNVINHLTQWETTNSYSFGNDRNSNIDINAILKIRSQVEQSLSKDNVFTSDQRGIYLQLQTVRKNREVELQQITPQTMQGVIIQQSFTGPCLGQVSQEIPANAQCSFTPALVTDRNSIDPKTFLPTRINQFGNVGDVISPATLDILAQPGFQNIGANGQVVGLDLYFPNLGATPGNSQGTQPTIARREEIETTPLVGLSRIRQILKANATEAVIGRTIRGTGFIIGDDNILLNTGVTAATELLPDAKPHLEGSTNPVNTNLNPNLFSAANNNWTPLNSWTIYQAGLGRAAHAQLLSEGKINLPQANFNGIWIGLSPVTKRSLSSDLRYEPTGPERVLVAAGGEGGINDNVSFISNVNGNTINSANLQNFYTQVYLTFLNRDVNLITSDKLTEHTKYYPHLSFTGNITNTHEVFRYYTGVIAADLVKAYIGADYTRNKNNWILNAQGIGYINPDQDYSSQVQTSIARIIPLSSNASLNLFTGLRYAFNQTSDPLETPINNYISVGARANVGAFSVGLTQYFDGVLPNSINTGLGVDAALNIGSQGRISAYMSPGNNQMSYGAIAEYKFGKDYYSPAIVFGWRRERYDFGTDSFDNLLRTNNDTFTIMFRMGAPTSSARMPG